MSSCTIDNFDIADIGMFILRGGDYDLLAMPERKEPQKNEWFEQDGVDADLSEVYFNAKKATIKFHLKADLAAEFLANLETFQTLLTSPGYRSIYIRDFDKTFTLRYVSCPQFTMRGGLVKPGTKSAEIEVQFSDDAPLGIFDNNLTPSSTQVNDTHVYLNDIELKNFGITVKNIYNTALQISDVKPGLLQITDRSTGIVANLSTQPATQSKKITIECVMMAESREAFYVNYNALFNNLAKAEELSLQFGNDKFIDCYYNGMSGFTKMKPLSQGAMFSFSLNLTMLAAGIGFATFDGSWITTFDNDSIVGINQLKN